MNQVSQVKIIILSLVTFIVISACSNNEKSIKNNIQLPIFGEYQWVFEIPGHEGKQTSTHNFTNNNIHYTMEGSVYAVSYNMEINEYNNDLQKIIAAGKGVKEGKFFAVFLKDITANSVMIYKAQTTSLKEAKEYLKPKDDDTKNHGWNKYLKKI